VYRQTGALIYANSSDSNETSSFVQERAKYLTMPDGKIKYHFVGMPWRHPSPGGWYFISLPPEISVEIRLLRHTGNHSLILQKNPGTEKE